MKTNTRVHDRVRDRVMLDSGRFMNFPDEALAETMKPAELLALLGSAYETRFYLTALANCARMFLPFLLNYLESHVPELAPGAHVHIGDFWYGRRLDGHLVVAASLEELAELLALPGDTYRVDHLGHVLDDPRLSLWIRPSDDDDQVEVLDPAGPAAPTPVEAGSI